MSNRIKPRNRREKTAGGCSDCNAYQTVKRDDNGVKVTVHHDPACPWLAGVTR